MYPRFMDNNPIQPKDESVTIILKGALSLERKISFKKATDLARLLADESDTPSVAAIRPSELTHPTQKAASSALEIIKTSNAKTFPQQIAALAFYVTQRDHSDFFDPKDIKSLLRRMGNPPQNFGRDLAKGAELLGYFAKEAPGQYIITEKGKELVLKGFGSGEEGTSRRRKIRKVRHANVSSS